MDTIKHAGKYVLERTRAMGTGVREGVHKIKDSAASVSTRARAAVEVVGDKIEKQGHDAKAEYHKQAVKH